MKLIVEYEQNGVIVMLDVGEFSPYFLALAYLATEEKFGAIDVSETGKEEGEWLMLELDEAGADLQDVAEFVEKMKDITYLE
jgi:hypothetical protein